MTYQELFSAATSAEATQEDINALGEWFSLYGESYWNGECYNADGKELYPLYVYDKEHDQLEISGYTFSSWEREENLDAAEKDGWRG